MMSFGDKSSRQWMLEEDEAEPIVRAAADGGVIFFDTADVCATAPVRGRAGRGEAGTHRG
jgi:1-deoxyxylulose-5-phosphate synthase